MIAKVIALNALLAAVAFGSRIPLNNLYPLQDNYPGPIPFGGNRGGYSGEVGFQKPYGAPLPFGGIRDGGYSGEVGFKGNFRNPLPFGGIRDGGYSRELGFNSIGSDEVPRYDFEYAVADEYSGNNFGQQETRDGYDTKGSYFVLLPDGRKQIVNYYVSGDSGYVAEVTYEGEAIYEDPIRPHHGHHHPRPLTPAFQDPILNGGFQPSPYNPAFQNPLVNQGYQPRRPIPFQSGEHFGNLNVYK